MSIQPTLVYAPAAPALAETYHATDKQATAELSQAQVALVEQSQPRFSAETAKLLHARLRVAAALLFVVFSAALVSSLLQGISSLWPLRVGILALVGGIFIYLARHPSLPLTLLRILETIVFALSSLQLAMMLSNFIDRFVAAQDWVSLATIQQQFIGAWSVLIFLYGTVIPNSWKRGLIVTCTMALLPYLILGIKSVTTPQLAELRAINQAKSPLPMPLVAAGVATIAAHVVNAARRDAFKARQFGQYKLIQRIGAGGMGEVYRAEHRLLKRPCAIKLIKPANELDGDSIAKFEREVMATAKLTHWNTIEIYDYGRTDEGTFYYVMEFLPGQSLEELVTAEGPLPAARAVHFLRQICGALQEAHAIGLIHRDIKPANIFASMRGGVFDVAKLLDFGLVKERSDHQSERHSGGSFSGTPLYMSPEQAFAYESVDARSDLYSLGAVGYYLLTGRPPFPGSDVSMLLMAHRSQTVQSPNAVNNAVPSDVSDLIVRCLAKSPADRYQTAEEFGSALATCSVAAHWTPDQARASWDRQRLTAQSAVSE